MKIKQIEWETRNNYQNYQTSVGLPFCYHATLSYCAFRWNWRIWRENRIVIEGHAFTVKDAKAECQKAWESFVMGAFEVSEGCEYCTMPATPLILDEWVHDDIGDVRALLETEICGNKLMTCADIRFEYREGAKEINYCPMCGRKLEETE